MNCKTCHHPNRHDIDLALLTRTHTLEALSVIYGLSVSSLFRHKKHLQTKMRRCQQQLQDIQALDSRLKLTATLDDVERAVQAAQAEGDIDRVIKGLCAGSRIILQMSKIGLPRDPETLYRLLSSPQRFSPSSPFPLPSSLFPGINDDPETLPEHMRDVSAKLPKNPDCRANNSQQYQSVNNCDKIYPKHPDVGGDPQGGESQSTAPPTGQTSSCQSLTANAQIPTRQMANPDAVQLREVEPVPSLFNSAQASRLSHQ